VIDTAGDGIAGTVAVAGGESIAGPVGGVPVAVAESWIDWWFRSAWVTM
jgi:hypothetical protein